MIQFSPSAISEIQRLQSRHGTGDFKLRVTVSQDGCLDFAYSLFFDRNSLPDDQIWNCGKLQVMVNSADLACLNGLAIDYSEDMMGGAFRFFNPNADRVCDCGNSFSII